MKILSLSFSLALISFYGLPLLMNCRSIFDCFQRILYMDSYLLFFSSLVYFCCCCCSIPLVSCLSKVEKQKQDEKREKKKKFVIWHDSRMQIEMKKKGSPRIKHKIRKHRKSQHKSVQFSILNDILNDDETIEMVFKVKSIGILGRLKGDSTKRLGSLSSFPALIMIIIIYM